MLETHSVCKDIALNSKDGPFECDLEVVNLHPTKGTQWVAYINIFFIHLAALLVKNYLSLIKNEMDLVYILNTKCKV